MNTGKNAAMKIALSIPLAVIAFALYFSTVQHPLACLAGVVLVMLAAPRLARARRVLQRLDDAMAPRARRAPPGWPFIGALVLGVGCRSTVPPRPPVALAEVETLECGGRVCAVTEVAGATMITVTE